MKLKFVSSYFSNLEQKNMGTCQVIKNSDGTLHYFIHFKLSSCDMATFVPLFKQDLYLNFQICTSFS